MLNFSSPSSSLLAHILWIMVEVILKCRPQIFQFLRYHKSQRENTKGKTQNSELKIQKAKGKATLQKAKHKRQKLNGKNGKGKMKKKDDR